MRSSKHGTENNRGISGHMYTVHQRLYHALNLGFRSCDEKGRKWQSTDVEIQRLVLRSISAFLDYVSAQTSNHPLVKDSVADMVGALEGILQCKSEAVLTMAAGVAVKLVSILPSSIVQSYGVDLVHPLSSLLSSHLLQVSISCATALNLILSYVSTKRENDVWEILGETETVSHIVSNIQDFSSETKPIEYFQAMALLLSTILRRWPSSRYPVWGDTKLIKVLEAVHVEPDFSVKVAILKLYSSLALCGNGAKKLLENGESILQIMVHCMVSSHPHYVRMEGFKLAHCLAISEQGCLKMMSFCCETIVKAIVSGMSGWSSSSGKVPNDQMSLLVEACRLALITRWAGEHHIYFWNSGIDRVLLDLLLDDCHKNQLSQHSLLDELISKSQEGLNANFLPALRPFVWDILGWLAAHCDEDYNPDIHINELCFRILITCACLEFVDSIRKGRHIHQTDITNTFGSVSASRAVLMMIYSPCKYISSKARLLLFEILKPHGKEYLNILLDNLNSTSSGDKFGLPDVLRTAINLMGLTCYSGLPWYRRRVMKSKGIKTLLAFMRWCLNNQVHLESQSFSPHLHNTFCERSCCWVSNDWEGKYFLLILCLWGLAELMHHSGFERSHQDIFSGQLEYTETRFINKLQEICSDFSSPGPRWFAAYILSFFGMYGFPSKFGRRIGKVLDEKEYTDIQLILSNGESLSVHGVLLMVKCPALLPSEKIQDTSSLIKKVHLSSHVDHQSLTKLLEFVYWDFLQAGEELVKKLKTFAKRCNLQPLLQVLCRKNPKWGAPIPTSHLTSALGPAGHPFSDIILEAKATETMCWTCSFCPLSVPHMHVHKIILWSSCDYLRALFQSGMQESRSDIIKVPVSWEALTKLVYWFYSDELAEPPSGCLWDNLETEEKLHELQPYIELCWLAEFWFLEGVQEVCSRIVVSYLHSARHLSVKVIQIAANLSQWKLAEVAANLMAPIYRQLHLSGELETLEEELVEMVRVASVRLSREGCRFG